MKPVISAALTTCLLAHSGCASIVGRSNYAIPLDSDPSQATLKIIDEDGAEIFSGMTPTTVSLESGRAYFDRREYTATFSKPGYQDETMHLVASMNGWYWGNFALGGIFGFLVLDPLTGCMFKFDEAPRKALLLAGPTIANSERLGSEERYSDEVQPNPTSVNSPNTASSENRIDLRELKKLHDEGIITTPEYDVKRKELLKRM
jgi:hypothetical protein